MNLNKAQAELIEAKNLLYELEFSLESKVNEISAAKEEISILKSKLKNHKYYKEKVKDYKIKLKEASKELQYLHIQYNSEFQKILILIEMQNMIEDKGIVLTREQQRKIKFHVKSITHAILKLLKSKGNTEGKYNIEYAKQIKSTNNDTGLSKELNLILDFWGRIMNELNNNPLQTIPESSISEWNSISSRAVEDIGIRGLNNYKKLAENINQPNKEKKVNNTNNTQVFMNIDDQLSSDNNEDRISKAKSSFSQIHNKADFKTPDSNEWRIKQAAYDALMISKEITTEDLELKCEDELKAENNLLRNELFTINHDFIPKYEKVIFDLQKQNESFQSKINELEHTQRWDDKSEEMLAELQKMQESIETVRQENEDLKSKNNLYESQVHTLKNVNESQQKIINFLNDSNTRKEYSSSPTFMQKSYTDLPLMKQNDKYSVISEDDKEADYSIEDNYNQISFVPSKEESNLESEEDEDEDSFGKLKRNIL